MATSPAPTVHAYLETLPAGQRDAIAAVRKTLRKRLPKGFEETMQYGMISYVVPLEAYPVTYNGQALAVASLGAQKHHMALYMMGIYADPELRRWFTDAFHAAGKKLDAGKSCVRFRKLEDLPLDVIGEAIARKTPADFIALYEASRGPAKKKTRAKKKQTRRASTSRST